MAARTLGRSHFQTVRQVLLPLLWPPLATGALLVFIDSLKELGVSLCYGTRKVVVRFRDDTAKPMEMLTLYLVSFPLGKEPSAFATPRDMPIHF